MENGADLFVFGAGVTANGAGAILSVGPAPMERVEWHFAAQVWAVKTHLRQKWIHLRRLGRRPAPKVDTPAPKGQVLFWSPSVAAGQCLE